MKTQFNDAFSDVICLKHSQLSLVKIFDMKLWKTFLNTRANNVDVRYAVLWSLAFFLLPSSNSWCCGFLRMWLGIALFQTWFFDFFKYCREAWWLFCSLNCDIRVIKVFLANPYDALCFQLTEAVSRRCSVKKVFLEILQNSQKNTCARVSFLGSYISSVW